MIYLDTSATRALRIELVAPQAAVATCSVPIVSA